ncbi:helix-hairpin-helix domain-containing protein [Phytoactinopolyspora halotolerans]|uniref:Helix-hairpin-helix domain-containing protein n=1 Tax=Phytoactinopolyspora halotolerans TaxID=1981512 RepID=A0A6L9S2X4_9ACTN|nr:helix-hairpin-helix domain-containing protein [Phytoactinopolyspora halotolerans]NED99545.1 hypothetical protein [Phytoactinopolyspora halotolerans]
MTDVRQFRRAALSLQEVEEQSAAHGVVSFAVADRTFASANTADVDVSLHLGEEEQADFLTSHPSAERLIDGTTPIGVRISLADIDGQQLNHWVRRAWLANAPQRLVAHATVAETATPGKVGDLPKAIGRPATQALVDAGITSLAQVAELTEAELKAMHGVGPKAIRVLKQELDTTGRSLKS